MPPEMKHFTVVLLLFLIPLEARGSLFRHRLSLFGRLARTSSHTYRSPPSYDTRYFEQRLDHFNRGDDRTFQQRYLYSSAEWDGKGPIFVYTGNEGDIAWFYKNTVSEVTGSYAHLLQAHHNCACALHSQGFAWDLAATYRGLLLYIEHRYYGQSLPFGPSSYQDVQHLNYLSSGQALADFATVITYIKVATSYTLLHMLFVYHTLIFAYNVVIGSLSVCIPVHVQKQLNTSVPVIAVGGSYGGKHWLTLNWYSITILL